MAKKPDEKKPEVAEPKPAGAEATSKAQEPAEGVAPPAEVQAAPAKPKAKRGRKPKAPAAPSRIPADADVNVERLISDTVTAAMTAALKELLPAAMATGINAARQMQLSDEEKQKLKMRALQPPDPTLYEMGQNCPECRQPWVKGAKNYACNGKHRKAVVMFKDEDLYDWWQSPMINSVHYSSGTQRQPVTVPADCNIEGMVHAMEAREKSYLKSRSHFGNAERGGVIDYARRPN